MKHLMAAAGLMIALVPAMASAQSSKAPDPTGLRACSGSTSKNYYFAIDQWLRRISHDLFQSARNEPTDGSLTNLRQMISGGCDVGMAQADVVAQFVMENPSSRDTLSVLKVMYREYVHVLCPAAMPVSTLTEFAKLKGRRNLIVDKEGSGTAVTWRLMRQVNDKLYGDILRDDQPSDVTSATTVMDSTDTCMLMVAGLNSSDMVSADLRSIQTQSGKPGLKLISVDDTAFLKINGIDGQPLYQSIEVKPQQPSKNQPGLYSHLITNGGFFSPSKITVLSVPALLMIRNDYKEAIGREKLRRIVTALVDSLPTVWARVNPAGQN